MSAGGAVAQVAAPGIADAAGPSAIEQALIEHSCSAVTAASPGGVDPYRECLGSQLRSMRNEFGRDLGRLSLSERRVLDSACNTRAPVGRETYLDCIRDQLASLRDRWNRANHAVLVVPPLPEHSTGALPVSLVVPAGDAPSSISGVWLAIGFVALGVAGGGTLLALKSRRAVVRKCRTCAGDVPGAGDLCPVCRHAAAQALRDAAVERTSHERAEQEEQRRLKAADEPLKKDEKDHKDEDLRRRQEEARRLEEAARQRRKEEEELRQRSRVAVDSTGEGDDVFDPYAILGVPRDPGIEAIDAAYQEARSKYSPDHVAHLGAELQEHFRRKAEAVDRAYLILIA